MLLGGGDEGSVDEKILATVSIISEYLANSIKEPNYFDIKFHLKNYKGKRRMGKFIEPSKSTLGAIKKTIEIIEDDWQDINKEVLLDRIESNKY